MTAKTKRVPTDYTVDDMRKELSIRRDETALAEYNTQIADTLKCLIKLEKKLKTEIGDDYNSRAEGSKSEVLEKLRHVRNELQWLNFEYDLDTVAEKIS